jgi:hypothetical protein
MKVILITLITLFAGLNLSCQTKEINLITEQEYAVYIAVLAEKTEILS